MCDNVVECITEREETAMKTFIKETGIGTLYSKIKAFSNGTVSVYSVLNGNEIYRGDCKSIAEAEAYFIINGYDLFSL